MSAFIRENNLELWFDIPVADLDRAFAFYAEEIGVQISKHNFNNLEFSLLEHDKRNGGCLDPRAEEVAPESGIPVHFHVHGRLHDAVDKPQAHGGKIAPPFHPLEPNGFRVMILSSEGNLIA